MEDGVEGEEWTDIWSVGSIGEIWEEFARNLGGIWEEFGRNSGGFGRIREEFGRN
jgi:hypothetical protein